MPDARGADERGRPRWRLVDGQQRLTTIYLIMRFIESRGVEVRGHFDLSYETPRPRFLEKLRPEDRWETPDAFYMHQAYEAIQAWFDDRHPNAKNHLASILLDPTEEERNTRVIWYQLGSSEDPQHEIEAFIRLNAGKIRLTNAELIRALFLRAGNFDRAVQNLSQIKMAQEWDRIEKRLQDDRFWYFLHGGPSPYATRIDHLFRVHLEAHHPAILKDIPLDAEFRTFLGFQKLDQPPHPAADDARSVSQHWSDVKQLAMRLEEWEQDRVLYHLVGFWITCRVGFEDNAKVIVDLIARRSDVKHHDFEESLKADLFRQLIHKKTDSRTQSAKQLRQLITARIDGLLYNNENIRPLLLLFNIATLLGNRSNTVRFPFDLYSLQRWDIEHIRSVESRAPQSVPDQKSWLSAVIEYWTGHPASRLTPTDPAALQQRRDALTALMALAQPAAPGAHARQVRDALGLSSQRALHLPERPGADEKARREMEDRAGRLLARAWLLLTTERYDATAHKDFNALYPEVLEHFGEKESLDADHSIGNLTLLDAHTNRSYRNAPFPVKRKRILALDKTGTFVPRCTTNVFLKYYSRRLDHLMTWSDACAESYQAAIIDTLTAFFARGGHRPEEADHA